MKNKFPALICFLLFATTFQAEVYAKETFFDFALPTKLLLPNYVYVINFSYLISGAEDKDFTVRPVMESGLVEIYDEEKKLWINQSALRSSFPRLASEMKIRFINFGSNRSEVCFEIQHIKSTNLYRAPCKAYWNRVSLGRYIELINDKILKWTR